MVRFEFAINEIISNIDTLLIAVALYLFIQFLASRGNSYSRNNENYISEDYTALETLAEYGDCECCNE